MVVVISIGFWDLHPREGGLGAKPSWMVLLSPSYGPRIGPYPPVSFWNISAIGFGTELDPSGSPGWGRDPYDQYLLNIATCNWES